MSGLWGPAFATGVLPLTGVLFAPRISDLDDAALFAGLVLYLGTFEDGISSVLADSNIVFHFAHSGQNKAHTHCFLNRFKVELILSDVDTWSSGEVSHSAVSVVASLESTEGSKVFGIGFLHESHPHFMSTLGSGKAWAHVLGKQAVIDHDFAFCSELEAVDSLLVTFSLRAALVNHMFKVAHGIDQCLVLELSDLYVAAFSKHADASLVISNGWNFVGSLPLHLVVAFFPFSAWADAGVTWWETVIGPSAAHFLALGHDVVVMHLVLAFASLLVVVVLVVHVHLSG